MSDQQPISLDPDAIAKRTASRYQRMVGELVEEVAQLSTYAAHLEQELSEARAEKTAKTDAWGDPTAIGGE